MNNIYFPSYNRSELVRAFEYLGCGNIIVPESQKKAYQKRYGKNVIAIPDKRDGHIAKKRNAVLDLIEEREQDGFGWMIDDDFVKLKRKKENIDLSGDECLEHLELIYIMAKDMKATFGGFDYSGDNMKLKDFQPFSLTKPVFQVFLINAKDKIRYDQRLRVCSDVEIWVQKMNQSRRLIKDNRYFAIVHGIDGGAESVIKYNTETRKKYAKLINEKWGYEAMIWNKTRFEFRTKIKGV